MAKTAIASPTEAMKELYYEENENPYLAIFSNIHCIAYCQDIYFMLDALKR